MGGASIGVASDGDALFTNPAGVGSEDGPDSKKIVRGLSMPNVTLGASRSSLPVLKAYKSPANSGEKIEQILLQSPQSGTPSYYFGAFPYITISRFQLGLVLNSWAQGYRDTAEDGSQKIDLYGISQSGVVAGFSLPYVSSGFSLGVTTRAIYRKSLILVLNSTAGSPPESNQTIKSSLNSTKGLGVDVGFLYQSSNLRLKPKMGLSLRDVGDTSYKSTKAEGNREVDVMNIGAGVSLNPRLGKWGTLTLALDGQRLSDLRVDWPSKLHVGAEISGGGSEAKSLFALRCGYNGEGVTAGGSLDLVFFNLGVAWYSQSVSPQTDTKAAKRMDERLLLNLSIDLRV